MNRLVYSLRRLFIAGLLVIVPIWGTYLILTKLFVTLDQAGRSLPFGSNLPGMGFLLLIGLILTAGLLVTNYLGRTIVSLGERVVATIPLVRNVYGLVKNVVDNLSPHRKGNFTRVVLLEYPSKGIFSLGFVTGSPPEEICRLCNDRAPGKMLSIFIASTPTALAGYLVFVHEAEVVPLSLRVEEAMKMVISGGLSVPERPVSSEEPSASNLPWARV